MTTITSNPALPSVERNSIHAAPLANRAHVAIFGDTNAGKSTLFNQILGQDMAIVSAQRGTTTDPVTKAMELLPFGPIALIDTAGLDDTSELGNLRVQRTQSLVSRCDAAIYTAEAATALDEKPRQAYAKAMLDFQRHQVPHLLVLTKADQLGASQRADLADRYPEAMFTAQEDAASIETLRTRLSALLTRHAAEAGVETPMIARLVSPGGTVLMVVPVDSEAPKGRLILPQVQLIRECLDSGIRCLVVRDNELEASIRDYSAGGIDLVVTDSQAFHFVAAAVPENIPLTSFSMLLAAGKGDFATLIDGLAAIRKLQDGDRVLISEACTHNLSHEDIGRIKLPRLLKSITDKKLEFLFTAGQQAAEHFEGVGLVVHCGACMISRKAMQDRVRHCREAGVAMTNYGLLLAYGNGIIERSLAIFRQKGLIA